MSTIDTLFEFFEHIPLSPKGWPVSVCAALANDATFKRWPTFPKAATLAHQRLGHGRGKTALEAKRGAVGELIEIASCCEWGSDGLTRAPFTEISASAWSPIELNGFSTAQLSERSNWNTQLSGLDWIPPLLSPDDPIDWVTAIDCTSGKDIWVPADAVFIGRRDAGDEAACAVADTNGCATAQSSDEALLRAIYELVERDATGRWWYGQRNCPILDASYLEVATEIERCLAERGRVWRLLDITCDTAIPTVAAIASDVQGYDIICGFATRGHLPDAVLSATAEMMQMEIKLLIGPEEAGELTAEPKNSLDPSMWGLTVPQNAASVQGSYTSSELQSCLDRLRNRNVRIAAVDLTREAFGLPTVRAMSPDLCHWKPRLAHHKSGVPDALGNKSNAQLFRG